MGLTQSVDNRDRKTIEFEVFDTSFQYIEKYVKNNNTRGLGQRFRREYDNSSRRVLDWSRVFNRNIGYVGAIKETGQLLRQARQKADRTDRKAIDQILDSARHVINKRKDELDPKLSIFGFVLWGGDDYNSHKVVVDAWNHFRSG